MNKVISNMTALAMVMSSLGWGTRLYHSAPPKKQHKCLLKGCNIMTEHNGGYCCAEHCKKARTHEHKG